MNADELKKAIRFVFPDAQFSFTGSDYESIKWDYIKGEPPTFKELEKALSDSILHEQNVELEKQNAKKVLLDKLGITADEAKLLLS